MKDIADSSRPKLKIAFWNTRNQAKIAPVLLDLAICVEQT